MDKFIQRWKPSVKIFLFQVWMMTYSNLKSRYRNTFAGMFWVILGPLIIYGVQSYIFSKVLWINVPDYSQFLLSGLLAWIFISQSIDQCTPLLISRAQLLTAYAVNPVVLILAQLLDNFINFLIAFFILLLPVLMYSDSRIRLSGMVVFPLAAFNLFIGTFGFCWLFSIANVFFRDTRFILSFMISVAYYLTPIFYPISMVPEEMRGLFELNPFYRLIEPLRISLYFYEPGLFWISMLKGTIVSIPLVISAAIIWNRRRNAIYLQL